MRCVCAVCVFAREREKEREEACEQEGKIKKERKSGRTQMQYLSAYNGEKYRLTSLLYILLFRMHWKKVPLFPLHNWEQGQKVCHNASISGSDFFRKCNTLEQTEFYLDLSKVTSSNNRVHSIDLLVQPNCQTLEHLILCPVP